MHVDWSTALQHSLMLVAVTQSGLTLAADSVAGNPPMSIVTAISEATNLRRVIEQPEPGQSRLRLARSA